MTTKQPQEQPEQQIDVTAAEWLMIIITGFTGVFAGPFALIPGAVVVGMFTYRLNPELMKASKAGQWVRAMLPAPEQDTRVGKTTVIKSKAIETLESPVSLPRVSLAPETIAVALKRIPFPVTLAMMGQVPQRRTAVPFGVTADGSQLWLDLETDLLHLGVYGTSSGGKDNFFRLMFYTLTKRNTPDAVQFFFLDGKNDWLLPNLRGLVHMWRDPAGGSGKAGAEAIKCGITAVQTEMERRFDLVNGSNCRTREQYMSKTGENIPLLVVVLSDVMNVVADEAETLLIDLVSKARAVGIRVVVSMQTPTGASMKWRSNLSTNASFVQTDETQDGPALGLREKAALRYRPSALPGPKQRPGVMVVRHGNEQYLVQVPLVDDDLFDGWVEGLQRHSASLLPASQSQKKPLSGTFEEAGSASLHWEAGSGQGSSDDDLLNGLLSQRDQRRDQMARIFFQRGMSQRETQAALKEIGYGIKTERLGQLQREVKGIQQ